MKFKTSTVALLYLLNVAASELTSISSDGRTCAPATEEEKKSWKDMIKEKALNFAKKKIKDRFSGRLLEDVTTKILLGTLDNPSKSTKALFEEMDDLFTTFLITSGPPQIIETNKNPVCSEEFRNDFVDANGDHEERFDLGWEKSDPYDWKKGFIAADIVEVTNDVVVKRIRTDQFLDTTGSDSAFLRNQAIFPLSDSTVGFNSEEELEALVRDTKLTGKSENGASPDPYEDIVWNGKKSSDENFSRFFLHGIGAAFLEQQVNESSKPELGPIEIDLDFMKNLEVREGFRPMGVKVYFDVNQKVTGIYDSHKQTIFAPGDEGWEGAKFLARSSALVLLTAREHLFQTHLLSSNYLSLASIKHLPPSHPLRRLINLFTFRTNIVNDNAFGSLVPEFAVLHRSVGFQYNAMLSIFANSFENSNVWEPFPARNMRPELLEMSSNGKLPYHSDAVAYYNVVERFVRTWLRESGYAATDIYAETFYNEVRDSSIGQKYELPEFQGTESMVHLLTQGIFMVTCYHEIIGTIIDYANDPECAALRVREDDADGNPSTAADVQAFINFLTVTASTGVTVPMLMRPYKNYFGEGGAPRWERKVWDEFLASLEEQAKKVEDSYETREVQFLFFNPRKFESAVSV